MKKIIFIIFIFLKISSFSSAQIGLLYSIGEAAAKETSKPKKEKLAKKYLARELIYKDTVSVMRVPSDKINSNAKSYILQVQDNLDKAKYAVSNEKDVDFDLNSIKTYIGYIGKADADWVTEFYLKEYNVYLVYQKEYRDKQKEINLRATAIQDSIKKVNKEIALKEKAFNDNLKQIDEQKNQREKDSLELVKNPYLYLDRNLWGAADHHLLTVFCGVDINFANWRLSSYVQEHLHVTSIDYKTSATNVIEKYVPKISTENEYLKVNYFVTKKNQKPAYATEDGKCNTITKCEITGTADLVLDLFLSYWPQRITFGGYKQGEIAHFQFMGDRVSLYGISAPRTYKIVISEDNVHFDYYKTFSIN